MSYASPDGGFAKHIYEDLRRSGVDVWGFEENQRFGIDFIDRFTSELQLRQVFCLLDSNHARESTWVRQECRIALDCRENDSNFIILPCLIQRLEENANWYSNELFKGQNHLAYLDLTQYENGIRKLCKLIGTAYIPYSDVQRDCDFWAEIQQLRLKRDQLQELDQLYKRYCSTRNDCPDTAIKWLREVIVYLDDLGAENVVTPRLALAVIHSNSDQHKEACQVFERLSRISPSDPRIWAGLAGARFFLGDYQGALVDYRHSEKLVRENGDPQDIVHLVELMHNIAWTILKIGDPSSAWEVLQDLPVIAEHEPNIAELKGKICLERGRITEAAKYFETALELDRERGEKPAFSLVSNLADTYHLLDRDYDEKQCVFTWLVDFESDPEMLCKLAACSIRNMDFQSASRWLTKAIETTPKSIIYRSELASILFYFGDIKAAKTMAIECHGLTANCAREHYYLGLAYHILESIEIAKLERQKANVDVVVANWPEYSELLSM